MRSLTPERLDEILDRASGTRVAVIGDLMLDLYLSGTVSRISPEAPVPVVHVQEERSALGGAANVAANLAGLGASVRVLGCVGRDDGGRALRNALDALGPGTVHPILIEVGDRPTTTKTRVMARNHQVVRVDRESVEDLSDEVTAEVRARLSDVIPQVDIVIIEDYNKGLLTPAVIRSVLSVASEHGVPVVVDPKFRHVAEYQGATVFKPNALELEAAMGEPVRAHDDAWLEAARQRFACEHLLVTLGEDGMALRSADGTTFRIPAVAREVFDVSGAGDTVISCIAIGLATGAGIREAAVMANLAAAIEVGKPGVAIVSPADLRAALQALLAPVTA